MKLYRIKHWPLTLIHEELVLAYGPRTALAAFQRYWKKKGQGPTRVLSVSEPTLSGNSMSEVVTEWKVVLDFDKD